MDATQMWAAMDTSYFGLTMGMLDLMDSTQMKASMGMPESMDLVMDMSDYSV
jgi:hypothetical protein